MKEIVPERINRESVVLHLYREIKERSEAHDGKRMSGSWDE